MSHLNINGVDKPLDHIRLNNVRSENFLDVTSPTEHLRTTVTPLSNGGAELSITNATWTSCFYRNIPVKSNSIHTITIYIDEYSGTGTFMIPCRQINGEGTAIFTDTITSTGKKTHTFTADGSTVWLGVYLNNSGTAATATAKIRIMLNEGSTALPYQPYLITKEAWEARDKNDNLLWGRADTFTGTGSISARCYGLPVKSWEIDGNSQQTGTPDPDNPIMPTFVGERTENLFSGYDIPNQIPDPTGALIPAPGGGTTSLIPITNGDIFMSGITTSTEINFWLYLYAADKTYVGRAKSIGNGETTGVAGNTIEGYANAKYARVRLDILTSAAAPTNVMLNTGSTAKSYEPYGYKLNITSAGQTVPVYLGQVQTTRRVKKLVFDGTEAGWSKSGTYPDRFYIRGALTGCGSTSNPAICTHFSQVFSNADRPANTFIIEEPSSVNKPFNVKIAYDSWTLTDFKTWLSDQYAAGTPVTIWYVLAETQTATINEPLAKIGTYADTLTSDQAGITIPTTDGSTTISVDTTLAPSKFEIKVHAKAI